MNALQNSKVVNVDEVGQYDIYIGRPSKWGNPFKIGPGKHTRKEALDLYKKWIIDQPELLEEIGELRGKTLGCHCKPRDCHGDTLVKLANS